jgi:HSP20 family protein
MQDELNQAFSQALGFPGRGNGSSGAVWAPAVEIAYRDGNLDVSAELPGLNEKDVKVEIENDFLTIHGERKVEEDKTEGGIRRTERRYGEFYRAIALPEGARPDQARAEFKDGILHVTIPVEEPKSNRREIPVQAGTSPQQGQSAAQKQAETPAGEKAA